jgi:NhaP-type Na+/H+ or K+/H+ antiporter
MEFGDATAEMIMLFAFIMFGGVLSALVPAAPVGAALALAAVTLFVARPAAVAIVLRRASISKSASAFIGWFGPRGLASLLLALLAVRAGFPNSETILAIAGVVVTVSVVLHGMTATPLAGWYANRVASETLEEERVSTARELLLSSAGRKGEVPLTDASGLAERLRNPDPPLVLDVRSQSSFDKDPETIPDALRVPPDEIEGWALKRPRDRWIVTYCT